MNLKIDIDPQTMVDFMEKCDDFGNRIRPTIVGHTKQCLHCDYGYDTGCNCRFMNVRGYWKGVKYQYKKSWNRIKKPSSDTIMYPVKESVTDTVEEGTQSLKTN